MDNQPAVSPVLFEGATQLKKREYKSVKRHGAGLATAFTGGITQVGFRDKRLNAEAGKRAQGKSCLALGWRSLVDAHHLAVAAQVEFET
jgi:hypothetical protein